MKTRRRFDVKVKRAERKEVAQTEQAAAQGQSIQLQLMRMVNEGDMTIQQAQHELQKHLRKKNKKVQGK